MCPGSSEPFYIVSYYIKWVTTFWTHSNIINLGYKRGYPRGVPGDGQTPLLPLAL